MNQHVAIFRHPVNIKQGKYHLRKGYNIEIMVKRKGFKLIELRTFKYFRRHFFGTLKSETFIWASSTYKFLFGEETFHSRQNQLMKLNSEGLYSDKVAFLEILEDSQENINGKDQVP